MKRSAQSPAFLGTCYVLDLRLDQEYLRSQPVNSEEGAPMGIGIWYEMWVDDPVLPGGPHSRMLANLLAAEGAGPEAVGPAKA